MNQKYFAKCFLTIMLFSIQLTTRAQIVTEEKLLGCWEVSKYEFLKPIDDSAGLVAGMKNYISCFEKNGKFVTKIKTKNVEKILGAGTFHIGSDGKTIYQKRNTKDDGEDSPGEVITLNDRELTIKADNIILHLVKIIN